MALIDVVHAQTVQNAPGVLDEVVGYSGAVKTDVATGAGALIQFVLLLTGIVFLGLMIYGGMRWFLSRGIEENVKKARETVIAAAIGLFIVLTSYAITTFLSQQLFGGGQSGNTEVPQTQVPATN